MSVININGDLVVDQSVGLKTGTDGCDVEVTSSEASWAVPSTEILAKRRQKTEEEIVGLEKLLLTEDQLIEAIEGESTDLEKLFKKGLTTRERSLLLRRQQREFEGECATNMASIARAKSAMAELGMQVLSLSKRLNEVVDELSKVEGELFDLKQQERSAQDVLTRTDVVAPVDGILTEGLRATT
jgi:chromosome segregation ATPase